MASDEQLESVEARSPRFTERAVRLCALAREEAYVLDAEEVELAHLILAILRDDFGVATQTLDHFGMSHEKIRSLVRFGTLGRSATSGKKATTVRLPSNLVGLSQLRLLGPQVPFSSAARSTLREAVLEANRLGEESAGPEHFLLAMTSQLGATQLMGSGFPRLIQAEPQEVRAEVMRRLQTTQSTPSGPRRIEHVDAESSARIMSAYEGVETYTERALADERRPIDPHLEEQIFAYRRMLSDWNHTAERDSVVYERLMAGLARLERELVASNHGDDQASPEIEAVHEAALEMLDATGRSGEEAEDEALLRLESELVPAVERVAETYEELGDALLEQAEAAGVPIADLVDEEEGLGERIDRGMDTADTLIGRVERARSQMVRVWKLLPRAARLGLYAGAVRLAGIEPLINWITTVISKVWVG